VLVPAAAWVQAGVALAIFGALALALRAVPAELLAAVLRRGWS